MSVERYFNEVTKKFEGNKNCLGAECKLLVQALLEADGSIFTIAQTDSDTDYNYCVWLRVYDTNIYLKVTHNSNMMLLSYHYGIDGTSLVSDGSPSLLPDNSGYSFRATVSRLGDFAFTIALGSNATNNGGYATFAKFVSDYDGEEYYAIYVGSASVGLTYYASFSPFGGNNIIRASDGVKASYSITSGTPSSSETLRASKASYVLMPVAYTFFNANTGNWLGHAKWGGKYDIYELHSSSGAYSINPTANYVVDGVTYKGTFNGLLIPVECS